MRAGGHHAQLERRFDRDQKGGETTWWEHVDLSFEHVYFVSDTGSKLIN